MNFTTPLVPATLIKRYKRFLADVTLTDGSEITVHCPNTGSMRGCDEPGARVWLSHSTNPKRKYAYTWELVEPLAGGMICIHSSLANSVVQEAIKQGKIAALNAFDRLESEVKYGKEKSRIDLLAYANNRRTFVEIKAVTLCEAAGRGFFPDAVSTRGAKHLRELAQVVSEGDQALLLFVVLHSEIRSVAPAREIDPKYAEALEAAIMAGVKVACYGCSVSPQGLEVEGELPFML